MARYIDLQRLLPICPSRRSLYSSAALVIQLPIIALITLPIVFKREISLYLLSVRIIIFSFSNLRSIIIKAFQNYYKKWLNIKLIVVIFISIQYRGFLYILKNPINNRLFPGAFYIFSFRNIFITSLLITYYLIRIMSIQVSSLKSVSLISYRLAYNQGKNLSISNITFSLYIYIEGIIFIFSIRFSIIIISFSL